jgi:hypothetical protein
MLELINTHDKFTPKQFGVNAHTEYTWSTNIQEKIMQFSFQCNRSDEKGVAVLKEKLKELLSHLIFVKNIYYLELLYRMIGHTRDIIFGKGEYTLTYMMIDTWYDFYPDLALYALYLLVKSTNDKTQPYGSWKDMKYFCHYCINNGRSVLHPLIQYVIVLINDQLRIDSVNFDKKDKSKDNNDKSKDNNNNINISLVSKWIPREDSKFNWLYTMLASDYFQDFLETSKTSGSYVKAITKCKTKYRQLVSKLNKHLDTIQIKQCNKKWSTIDFTKVTSITLAKQKKAFMNVNSNGKTKKILDLDRRDCALNIKFYIENSLKNNTQLKGQRIDMEMFTKIALDIIKRKQNPYLSSVEKNTIQYESDLLNSQWKNNSIQNSILDNYIALVDISDSMSRTPMYVANAIGIRIAEKSKLGKRVLTFSNKPQWINLDDCHDFVTMTEKVCTSSGLNTNLYAALDILLNAIIDSKLTPAEVKDMTIVILSDMQINHTFTSKNTTMYDNIQKKFNDTGMRLYKKPFKLPHIVFWNLGNTSGFPCLSCQNNVSMISGYNPTILNVFCKHGIRETMNCTPWSCLEKILMNDRYTIMGKKFAQNNSL